MQTLIPLSDIQKPGLCKRNTYQQRVWQFHAPPPTALPSSTVGFTELYNNRTAKCVLSGGARKWRCGISIPMRHELPRLSGGGSARAHHGASAGKYMSMDLGLALDGGSARAHPDGGSGFQKALRRRQPHRSARKTMPCPAAQPPGPRPTRSGTSSAGTSSVRGCGTSIPMAAANSEGRRRHQTKVHPCDACWRIKVHPDGSGESRWRRRIPRAGGGSAASCSCAIGSVVM